VNNYNLGPLMVDVAGYELSSEDKEILEHPAIGGVIIFARNYDNIDQIKSLNAQIKNLKNKNSKNGNQLLIAVDQEGGTVQRIKEPLTVLPSMSELGKYYEYDSSAALLLTKQIGWLLASELLTLGFDFSFTPVVDLNLCDNNIIKFRAFHKKSDIVADLAFALKQGLNQAGMAAVAKHFPGHGGVELDSHNLTPVDHRDYNDLDKYDLIPYKKLFVHNLEAIMTAHLLFSSIDRNIVTFSKFWLDEILREKLGFHGLIISDDLNMQGANFITDEATGQRKELNYEDRFIRAVDAGCELILLCNNRTAVTNILNNWSNYNWSPGKNYFQKLNIMRAKGNADRTLKLLKTQPEWLDITDRLSRLAVV
jgi:beta-N-acetylhexosaminidase